MNRKGISPLIAAVMLLAFVMAIGGMFSEWSGEMVRSTTADTTDSQGQVLDCSARTIRVEKVATGPNDNWVNATLRADGGQLGEVQVNVAPSQATDSIQLNKDGGINTTGVYTGGQQDSFRAASTDCRVSIEHDLEYN